MISSVIRWSLRYPLVVCALAATLAVYGVLVLTQAKYDVFPEFVPPQAVVQTEPRHGRGAGGAARDAAIEQAISGATESRQSARDDLGSVGRHRDFSPGHGSYRSRQIVAEALGEVAARLPLGVKTPKLSPLVSSTMDLLKLGS